MGGEKTEDKGYACKGVKMYLGRRKTRTVANHKHYWILDKNNFGRCRCGATKQFPIESKLKLSTFERSIAERLGVSYIYGDWLQEKKPAVKF